MIIRNFDLKDTRMAIQNEDINIIGFYINYNNIKKHNNILNSCCPYNFNKNKQIIYNKDNNEIIKINNDSDFTNSLNKIKKIIDKTNIKYNYNYTKLYSYKKYKNYLRDNFSNISYLNFIDSPYIKYVYINKYPYYKKFNDNDLQRNFWLNNTIDKGNLYYLYLFLVNNIKNNKQLLELLMSGKYTDNLVNKILKNNIINDVDIDILKQYIKDIINNTKLHNYYINLLIYKNNNIKLQNEIIIKSNKLKWAIINLFGISEFNKLESKSQDNLISLYNFLTKEQQNKVEQYIKKNEDNIKFYYCEFDDARKNFINSENEIDKYQYLKYLLNTYSNKKYPSLNSKDQNIYCSSCKKSFCKNKEIACMHEKIYYIDLYETKNEKEKTKIINLLDTHYFVYSESEGYIECKYCSRYVKEVPGVLHDKIFENDKLITKDGIKTEQEKYLLIMAEEFINLSSRFDLNKEHIVSSCIKSIILDTQQLKNNDKKLIKKELIEISFISATFIQFILVSKNFKLNTNICKIVNFKVRDLINYCLCIIKNKYPLILKKADTIKIDVYKSILNRINYLDNTTLIQNLKSNNYKLDINLQYNKKHENFKIISSYEKLIEKNNIKIDSKNYDNLIIYISKKYMYLLEKYYKNKDKFEYYDIIEQKTEYINYIDFKYINKLKNLLNSQKLLKKSNLNKNKFEKNIKNININFKYWNFFKDKINENQISDKYIENYFSKVCLDNLPHTFNNSIFCFNCGRDINTIDKIQKKEIGIYKRYYNIIQKKENKNVTKKIYIHNFSKNTKKTDNYYSNIIEKLSKAWNIENISKMILKNVSLIKSSNSINTESSSSDINLNLSFVSFIKNLGYYINNLSSELLKSNNDKDKINIQLKYDRIRMYNLKQYIYEFILILNILKNKQINLNIKNIYGYEYLEKYVSGNINKETVNVINKVLNDTLKLNTIQLNEILDDIIYSNNTYSKKNIKLYNILFTIIYELLLNQRQDNNLLNNLISEFFIKLRNKINLLDITYDSKTYIINKDEEQKKQQYDKIYRITDDEMVDLGISYIDLKKITDVEEYQDVIDKVDDYRNKELDYDFDYDSNNVDDLPDFEQFE